MAFFIFHVALNMHAKYHIVFMFSYNGYMDSPRCKRFVAVQL